jgi:hypothetical protein
MYNLGGFIRGICAWGKRKEERCVESISDNVLMPMSQAVPGVCSFALLWWCVLFKFLSYRR